MELIVTGVAGRNGTPDGGLHAECLEDFRERLHQGKDEKKGGAWRRLDHRSAGLSRIRSTQRQTGDLSKRLPHLIKVGFEGAGSIDECVLELIGEIERIGEGKASGQQPDGEEKKDFCPDESTHRLKEIRLGKTSSP